MSNKKFLNIILLIFGIFLFVLGGIFLKGKIDKNISGVLIGIGSSLFGMCLSNLWQINFYKKHPDEMKTAQIELLDERNTMIRNKAKAQASEITKWFIMGTAYINITINAPLWFTLIIVCVFLLYFLIEIYFINKYQHEL